jgi:4-hydroxy-tetrahydrodipicolinate synthase
MMSPRSTRRVEVLSAVPTLFDESGGYDAAGNERLLADLHGRADGVFVAGTTGEFPALERSERRLLAETAVRVFGADRVVVHVGAAATRQVLALVEDALAAGATRLAVLTPYYLPLDLDAVQRHFGAVTAAAGDAAAYGYLFAERSGVAVEPDEFAALASATGLSGVKLSGAASDRIGEYVAAAPGVAAWSGADTRLADVVRCGGAGVVSGLSAAFPEPFAALADAVAAGDDEAERAAQARADEVLAALGGTVPGIKAALRHLGYGSGALRMPAAAPTPGALEQIARLTATARA